MEIGLAELEQRLRSPIPRGYVAFVESTDPASLRKRGFDPKTLCVLNLERREIDNEGETESRLFLSGDGCGNYFFVPLTDKGRSDRVLLWSHDPPGIEDAETDLRTFLSTRVQEDPIRDSLYPRTFCIARTDCIGESVLDPISLKDWKKAIASCDGVRYRGYLEMKNPFTEETVKVTRPGVAVAECDGREVVLELLWGRVEGDYAPPMRRFVAALSSALGAKLRVRTR
jgi:hypothetical protein